MTEEKVALWLIAIELEGKHTKLKDNEKNPDYVNGYLDGLNKALELFDTIEKDKPFDNRKEVEHYRYCQKIEDEYWF